MKLWAIDGSFKTWQKAIGSIAGELYHYYSATFKKEREREELTQIAVCQAVHRFSQRYTPGKRMLLFAIDLVQSAYRNHPGIVGVGYGKCAKSKEHPMGSAIVHLARAKKYNKEEQLDYKLALGQLAPEEAKAIHLRMAGVHVMDCLRRSKIAYRRYRQAGLKVLTLINPSRDVSALVAQAAND